MNPPGTAHRGAPTGPQPITGRELALVLLIVQEQNRRILTDEEQVALAKLSRLRGHLFETEVEVGVTGGLLARVEVTAVGDQAELVAAHRQADGRSIETSGHLIHRDFLLGSTAGESAVIHLVREASGALTRSLQDWARA